MRAEKPGDLVCLDPFYIGMLEGVGKVRPLTACDAANTFAVVDINLDSAATATAQFMVRRVVPAFRKAGWATHRVLSDQGYEFRGAFDHACTEMGIHHTRTKPHHA